jgi:anti-sigma regulatory factor (Ser/Thr protein kinase)
MIATAPAMLRSSAPLLAERMFLGLPAEIRAVRGWVNALLEAALADAYEQISGVCELIATELATNAILHTASGDDGGRFAVIVVARVGVVAYEIEIHVRDAGPTERTGTALRADDDGRGLGLNLVAELAASNGQHPGSECATDRDKEDLTIGAHCRWARFEIPFAAAVEVPDGRP